MYYYLYTVNKETEFQRPRNTLQCPEGSRSACNNCESPLFINWALSTSLEAESFIWHWREMLAINGKSANLVCWALRRDFLQPWREATNIVKNCLIGNLGGLNPTESLPPHLNGLHGPNSLDSRTNKGKAPCGTASALPWELGDSDSMGLRFIIYEMGLMVVPGV